MHFGSHSRPNCVKKYDLVFKVRHLLYYLCLKNASVHLFWPMRLFFLASCTNKKESCLQDSPPAAGRICDIVQLRRSAILAEHFLCNRNEVSYYTKRHLPARRCLSHSGNAGDRNRTGTMSPPQDFKSCASASSATPAYNLRCKWDLQGSNL